MPHACAMLSEQGSNKAHLRAYRLTCIFGFNMLVLIWDNNAFCGMSVDTDLGAINIFGTFKPVATIEAICVGYT